MHVSTKSMRFVINLNSKNYRTGIMFMKTMFGLVKNERKKKKVKSKEMEKEIKLSLFLGSKRY